MRRFARGAQSRKKGMEEATRSAEPKREAGRRLFYTYSLDTNSLLYVKLNRAATPRVRNRLSAV